MSLPSIIPEGTYAIASDSSRDQIQLVVFEAGSEPFGCLKTYISGSPTAGVFVDEVFARHLLRAPDRPYSALIDPPRPVMTPWWEACIQPSGDGGMMHPNGGTYGNLQGAQGLVVYVSPPNTQSFFVVPDENGCVPVMADARPGSAVPTAIVWR